MLKNYGFCATSSASAIPTKRYLFQVAVDIAAQDITYHICIDHSGSHSIHSDPVLCNLLCKGMSKGHDPSLAGSVV